VQVWLLSSIVDSAGMVIDEREGVVVEDVLVEGVVAG
jgi:hypothetical protein